MILVLDESWKKLDVRSFSSDQDRKNADMFGVKSAIASSLYDYPNNAFTVAFEETENIPLNVFNNMAMFVAETVAADRTISVYKLADCLVACPHLSQNELVDLSKDIIGLDRILMSLQLRENDDAFIDNFDMDEEEFLDNFYYYNEHSL